MLLYSAFLVLVERTDVRCPSDSNIRRHARL